MRDYKKNTTKTPQKTSHSRVLSLCVGIMVLALTTLSLRFYILHKHNQQQQKNTTDSISSLAQLADSGNVSKKTAPKNHIKKAINVNPNAKNISHENSQSQFDFYAMLPKMNPEVPQVKPVEVVTDNGIYQLQIASVQTLPQARQVQQRVAALGITSSIAPFTHHGETWYRIVSDQYHSFSQAQDVQDQLRLQNIDTLLLTLKSPKKEGP